MFALPPVLTYLRSGSPLAEVNSDAKAIPRYGMTLYASVLLFARCSRCNTCR